MARQIRDVMSREVVIVSLGDVADAHAPDRTGVTRREISQPGGKGRT